MMPAHISVLGIPLSLPSRQEFRSYLRQQLLAEPGTVSPARLFTLNPEFFTRAFRDSSYRDILAASECNVVDGAGLALAIRLRAPRDVRQRLPRGGLRLPGSDIIHDLALATADARRPLLIVGGSPRRLEKACARLRSDHFNLTVHGFSPEYSATLPLKDQGRIEHLIEAIRPATVVACLGAPKQERWIAHTLECFRRCDVRVAAGLGGTVDFLSGEIPRAPLLVRRIGAEWLYRSWIEPHRWRRHLECIPPFALRAAVCRRFITGIPVCDGNSHSQQAS